MKSTLIGIAAVVVLGGGYLAYSKFAPALDAMEIMDRAIASTVDMNSYSTKGTANLNFSAPESEERGEAVAASAKYNFSGSVSKAEENSLGKGAFRLDMDINVDGPDKIAMKPGVDFVFNNKVFYLKLDLPKEIIDAYPFAATYNAIWIGVDLDEMVAKGLIQQADLDKITEASANQDPALMGKFKDAIVNSRIFKDLSVKDGDMIDGLATYKLSMSLDVTRIDEFVIEYGKIMDEKAVTEMTDRDKEQLKEMEKEVAKILKSNKFTFVTEKESGLVRSAAAEIAFADADSGMEGSFDMNVEYNDINKPVAVEVPAKSTSLLELVGPYLGMFMPQTGGALPTR